MSIKVTEWALKQKLRGLQKSVLLMLAYHADDHGKCWPGIALLGEECGISRSSVTRHIKSLEEGGFLSKESRHDAKGYRRSNAYQLHITQDVKFLQRNSQCREVESLSATTQPSKVSDCDGYIIEQSLEPSKELPRDRSVFMYWQAVMDHSGAKLDQKRKRIISRALKDYSVEDLRLAIDGCKASPWHRGGNPDGRVYDSLGLIFRDAEHIEQFIGYASKSTQSSISLPGDGLMEGAI